ncbi:DUF2691 family protein [Bacillus sp. AG4(2022)]|nr:DUF2691 family protein [Bacillus sp. AG4(2022)]MDT0162924.1 DUF2691 family protein [Bacillus sp. AG4(2022)]
MIRGMTFEIPNEYGRFLFEILLALKASSFEWMIAGEEGYFIENGELAESFSRKIKWSWQAGI